MDSDSSALAEAGTASVGQFECDGQWIFPITSHILAILKAYFNVLLNPKDIENFTHTGWLIVLNFNSNLKHLQLHPTRSIKRSWMEATYLHWFLLFFFSPIKRNAQISKATTYKWPYNSNFIFCSYLKVFSPRWGVVFFVFFLGLHFVPWTFAVKLHSGKKQSKKP